MLEFILNNILWLSLSIVIAILFVLIVLVYKLFKKVNLLTKQNNSEHKILYKNQTTLTTELSKLVTILRSIEDSINKSKNIMLSKVKTYSDYENMVNSFKRELETEQQKTKKAEGVVNGLMRKLNKINQENNYNQLTNK